MFSSLENHTGMIYELDVQASDQGSPPRSALAKVKVNVLDTVNSRPDVIVDVLKANRNGHAEVRSHLMIVTKNVFLNDSIRN